MVEPIQNQGAMMIPTTVLNLRSTTNGAMKPPDTYDTLVQQITDLQLTLQRNNAAVALFLKKLSHYQSDAWGRSPATAAVPQPQKTIYQEKNRDLEAEIRRIHLEMDQLRAANRQLDGGRKQLQMLLQSREQDSSRKLLQMSDEVHQLQQELEQVREQQLHANPHPTTKDCLNLMRKSMREICDQLMTDDGSLPIKMQAMKALDELYNEWASCQGCEDPAGQALKQELERERQRADLLSDQLRKAEQNLESLPLLRAQAEVYQADFRAEREAREKIAGEKADLMEQLERIRAQTSHQDVCDKSSPAESPSGVAASANESVKTNGPKSFSCPKCNKSFNVLAILQTHVNACLDQDQ